MVPQELDLWATEVLNENEEAERRRNEITVTNDYLNTLYQKFLAKQEIGEILKIPDISLTKYNRPTLYKNEI